MQKIIFTEVTREYLQSNWRPPVRRTEMGPFVVTVPDHLSVKQVAEGFFDGNVVDYRCQVQPV